METLYNYFYTEINLVVVTCLMEFNFSLLCSTRTIVLEFGMQENKAYMWMRNKRTNRHAFSPCRTCSPQVERNASHSKQPIICHFE
jgi:hypothetical protein